MDQPASGCVHTSIVIATPLKDFYHNISFMPLTKTLLCIILSVLSKLNVSPQPPSYLLALPPTTSREVFIALFQKTHVPFSALHLPHPTSSAPHTPPTMHFAHPGFFFLLLSFQVSSTTVAEFLLNIASCPHCPYMPCYCCIHTTLLCKYLQAISI